MLLILAFLAIAGALLLLGKVITQPHRERQASLRRVGSYAPAEEAPDDPVLHRLERRYGATAARLARRLDPRLTDERIAEKLLASGLARSMTPNGFLALKVLLAAAGVVGGALLGVLFASGVWLFVLAAGLGAVGFFLPDWIASNQATKRRDRIRRDLPDALDILAVSVQAGHGFEGGIAKLTENMGGPLVDEFNVVLNELRVGEARSVALRRMAARINLPEVTSVVNSLIQAEELGSPLGRMLTVQAQESRHRRQVAAEERAMKAPVKMLIPTVLFIFPAMFVVILGPAVIEIAEAF